VGNFFLPFEINGRFGKANRNWKWRPNVAQLERPGGENSWVAIDIEMWRFKRKHPSIETTYRGYSYRIDLLQYGKLVRYFRTSSFAKWAKRAI